MCPKCSVLALLWGLQAPSLQGSPVHGARLAPARPPLSRREVGSRKHGPARDKGPVYITALLWHGLLPSRCARGGGVAAGIAWGGGGSWDP